MLAALLGGLILLGLAVYAGTLMAVSYTHLTLPTKA